MILICVLASVTVVISFFNLLLVCCFSDEGKEAEDREQEEYLRKWREEHHGK